MATKETKPAKIVKHIDRTMKRIKKLGMVGSLKGKIIILDKGDIFNLN